MNEVLTCGAADPARTSKGGSVARPPRRRQRPNPHVPRNGHDRPAQRRRSHTDELTVATVQRCRRSVVAPPSQIPSPGCSVSPRHRTGARRPIPPSQTTSFATPAARHSWCARVNTGDDSPPPPPVPGNVRPCAHGRAIRGGTGRRRIDESEEEAREGRRQRREPRLRTDPLTVAFTSRTE